MATTHGPTDRLLEYCPLCGTERSHDVSLTLVTESDGTANAAYSREPYRVTECRECGRRTERRMNNA